MMVGHKHMCLYPSFFHDKNCKILIGLAISTCAYMRGNKVMKKDLCDICTSLLKVRAILGHNLISLV